MKALVVIDMLYDFVHGALANPAGASDHPIAGALARACPQRAVGRGLLERRASVWWAEALVRSAHQVRSG